MFRVQQRGPVGGIHGCANFTRPPSKRVVQREGRVITSAAFACIGPSLMALRVGFNATPLLSPLTGIGQYIVNLGQALVATGEVDAYSFYGYRWRHESPASPPGLHRASR